MVFLLTIAALIGFCLLFYTWFSVSTRLGEAKSAKLMHRAESNPEEVELIRLVEGTEAILVGIQFREEVLEFIPGVQGVAAVRLFDELCEMLPDARHDGIKANPRKHAGSTAAV